MNWRVDFSRDSLKFLSRNGLSEGLIVDEIKLALRKFNGENLNVNIKKLSGKWYGFHRIRSGRLRIILEFQFERCRTYVEKIDWRGGAYK